MVVPDLVEPAEDGQLHQPRVPEPVPDQDVAKPEAIGDKQEKVVQSDPG